MDVRQLRTIVHVAELGRISLAAERLHIAQSALTRQIQSLEDELRVKLFRRHGRGVELTEHGEAVFARATVILREIEGIYSDTKFDPATVSGEVSFGIPPTVADVLAGALIERCLRAYPQIKVRIVTGYSGYVLDWLQRGFVDIGILYEAKHPPTIKLQPLLTEQLFLIERRAGDRPARDGISLAELAATPLVLPGRQHGLRQLLDDLLGRHGHMLNPLAEMDSLPAQIDLVRRGVAATVLPLLPVFDDVRAGKLSAVPLTGLDVPRTLMLATPIDRMLTPATRLFSELVVAEINDLSASGRWTGVSLLRDMPDWHIAN
ncbi:LysR family transcriptional regulator [Bosea sp. (in: a-proteobacteria)]|uniref:LysR family transcriptional regulator n=1 Tax=Bosea sp. (in: a-proteobacteria) TaxID=1871050 RepID=UPI0026263F08|nr:LysR family transcriptional regulator [Bosea sp. (in: a-proteobacteria)]MCO5090904.1 LysR family transcriptional regulator [Bosea sp. (in: a-proteobacteria)]